ncbi:hypothetical protein BC628DRAFT_1378160 [Trametes gibbosa]|nr:hypothetical protein BC628DRAFT_1378160 [Trametes gibbosa]
MAASPTSSRPLFHAYTLAHLLTAAAFAQLQWTYAVSSRSPQTLRVAHMLQQIIYISALYKTWLDDRHETEVWIAELELRYAS